MPIAATTARIHIDLPTAHTMTQSALDTLYTAIKTNAKIQFVRIHAPWNVIQPTNPTTFVWVGLDRAVNRAFNAGMTPIIVLQPPKPTWAAKDFDPNLFAGFAKGVANRYKQNGRGITRANRPKAVLTYQLWDQPNAETSYLLPYRYVDILKKTYPAIKKGQPGATIIMGALQACRTRLLGTNQAIDPVTYLRRIYDLGGKNFFDAAAYNPLSVATTQYPVPPPPSALTIAESDELRTVMNNRGDKNKKMHWTTVGYSTSHYTQLEQAAYLDTIKKLAEARRDYVAGLGVYTYQDPAAGS